jgi:phospholipid/cholesterol/gamma-HCH transport system substrate-binding protein
MTATVTLPGSGRLVSRRAAAGLGIAMAALIVGSVLVVVASFTGAFGSYATVRAVLPAGAPAPQLGSPVEYRDVTVGQVESSGSPVGNGQVSIVLHMKPGELDAVPRSVRATVGPLSIFGTQYVNLEPLHGTRGPALASGDTIASIPAGPNASLQDTIADFYDVLTSIQPVQLESALDTMATALRGQGQRLGSALHGASQYLKTMIPLLPTLERDLRLLQPVANDLKSSTPDILGILRNLAVTGRTIVSDASALHELLGGGAQAVGQFANVVTKISKPLDNLLIGSGPLLNDVSANSNEVADVLSGLDAWSRAWTAAESHGPYLSISSTIDVKNPADLVLAGLGAPNVATLFADGLGSSLVGPPVYTAADCPSYGSMTGTDCGSSPGAAADAQVTSTIPGPAEERAAGDLLTGLNKGRAVSSPAVAALLVGPLLNDMAAA